MSLTRPLRRLVFGIAVVPAVITLLAAQPSGSLGEHVTNAERTADGAHIRFTGDAALRSRVSESLRPSKEIFSALEWRLTDVADGGFTLELSRADEDIDDVLLMMSWLLRLPHVICDPELVAKERAEMVEVGPVGLLKNLPKGSFYLLDDEALLATHGDAMKASWREILARRPAAALDRRARALAALTRVGERPPDSSWIELITSIDDDSRVVDVLTPVYRTLGKKDPIRVETADLAPRLEAWMRHENEKIRDCGEFLWRVVDFDGKSELAHRIIRESRHEHRALRYGLAQAGDPFVFEIIDELLASGDSSIDYHTVGLIENAAEHPATRATALQLAREFGSRSSEEAEDYPRGEARRVVARLGTEQDLCLLARWSLEPPAARECAESLQRRLGTRLPSALAECGLKPEEIEVVRLILEPPQAVSLEPEMLKRMVLSDIDASSRGEALADYLRATRTRELPEWALSCIENLEGEAGLDVLWALHGYTIFDLVKILHESGLVRHAPDREQIERIDTGNDDMSMRFRLLMVLEELGDIVWYDLEGIEGYPELLRSFSKAAGERWNVEDSVEWQDVVRFVSDGCVYRFAPEEGRYYDSDGLLFIVNRSLVEQGRPERFVPVQGSEYDVIHFFGDPAAVRHGLSRVGLPVGRPNQAPRTEAIVKAIREFAPAESPKGKR